MTPLEKYKNASAFKMAVQSKLKAISREEGIDINRLYRHVGYTHFLSRLFHDRQVPWALKGGHALELRLQESRATKDVDLSLKEGKFFSQNGEERIKAIKEEIIKRARIDLFDFFDFIVTGPKMELENAPYGGARFGVEVQIEGKIFTTFDLDVGIGDVWIEPHDDLVLKNYLDFSGFESREINVINVEQHFAEKIHAYTLPREGRTNSRVKDLVDLYLLVQEGGMDQKLLINALNLTFERRATHEVPEFLIDPPTDWDKKFKTFGLEISIEEAFLMVTAFYQEVLE